MLGASMRSHFLPSSRSERPNTDDGSLPSHPSRQKKRHALKLVGPNVLRTFLTLTLRRPGIKKLLPSTEQQKNPLFGVDVHDLWRGHRTRRSPCRKRSPAKGVWQKSDEKSDRSVRKSDRKVTGSVPKTKKVIELLLPTSFCGTLRRVLEKLSTDKVCVDFLALPSHCAWCFSSDYLLLVCLDIDEAYPFMSSRKWLDACSSQFRSTFQTHACKTGLRPIP